MKLFNFDFKKWADWPLYAGIFVTSLSILSLEVILNRMFALTFWHHFAFIILSVALFGIGLGGLLVFFVNRFVQKFVPVLLAVLSIALAFSIPWVLQTINAIPLDMNAVATDPVQQKNFRDFFFILVIPFMIGGYIFSTLFTNYHDKINKLYFFDLLGGGLGCFFALLIFPHNGPLVTAFVVSIAMIIAGAIFAYKQHVLWVIPVLLLIFADIFLVYPSIKNTEVRVDQSKRNTETLGEKIWSDWDNFGYVAVVSNIRNSTFVTADYSCFTYLYNVEGMKDYSSFKSILSSHYYPYTIKKNPEDVGIVGVGAGKDVLLALGSGAKNIYGAEFNSTIYRVFHDVFAKQLNHVGSLPNVHIAFEEGRFFIRSSPRKYDVLVFDNSISQVAVSSGSFTIAESYLFTVEAMMDYISHLKPGGVIYLSNPIPHAKRFTTLLKEAFHRLGRDKEFASSIIVTDEENPAYRKCKVLIKDGGFTKEEVAKIAVYSASLKHIPLYLPGYTLKTDVEKLVDSKNMAREYQKSDQELRPSTDDWPFFSQHIKPEAEKLESDIYAFKSYYPQPFLMLKEITGQVAFYSALFLLLPLVLLNLGGLRKLKNKVGSIVYFASLGLGFMLLEVVLMQKYTLILGHPAYSFSVVLSTLLMSAGIGSFISEKIKNPYSAIRTGLIGILITTALSYIVTFALGSLLVGLPFIVRVIGVIILIGGSGIFMGFMMPSGIRVVSKVPSAIPWMWSINGVFSVVASFIAVIIAILYGFTAVFVLGLAVYVIGTVVFIFQLKLKNE